MPHRHSAAADGLEAWDGMRCVDYLAGRPDIDAERLGICGQSGGGTQTAQLFAIDERLKAGALQCIVHGDAKDANMLFASDGGSAER